MRRPPAPPTTPARTGETPRSARSSSGGPSPGRPSVGSARPARRAGRCPATLALITLMLPSVLGWGAPDGGAASAAGSAPPSDPGATNAGASSRVSTRPAHVHINLSAPTPAPRARGTSEHPGDANPGESATPASPDGTHPDGTDPDVTTSPTTRTTPAPGGATSRQGATQRPAATPPPGGHGLPGPADHDPRTTSAGLDWNTETPDELDYTPVFEPAITPWKRVVALERVTGAGTGYALQPSAGPTRLVRPGEPAGRGERSFRGRLALAAAPGRWQPLPSVAPDQRYVYAVSTPRATTDLAVDDHGNHFVRSSSTVPFELIVEVAVDARYFADPSDADPSDADRATGASVATGTGAALGTSGARPPAPPEVPELLRTDARVVARWLGIAEDAPPRTIVAQLAAWFRGFEPGAFPADARSDRPLFDIVMTRVGACRHRALAFTMIAQGLGVPTRYVQNEAHAFVEVRLGDAGWQRLDLGGAPARLRLRLVPVSAEAFLRLEPDLLVVMTSYGLPVRDEATARATLDRLAPGWDRFMRPVREGRVVFVDSALVSTPSVASAEHMLRALREWAQTGG